MSFYVEEAMYTWIHHNQHKCSVELLHTAQYLYLMYEHIMCSVTTNISHIIGDRILPQHMAIVQNNIHTGSTYRLNKVCVSWISITT